MSLQDSNGCLLEGDLKQFFGGLLSEAADRAKLQVSPLALDYVSSLLYQFHETAKLFIQKGVRLPVLSDMLAEALEADLYRRVTLLRQLGDTSLMVSGYFPEALQKKLINRSYYFQMGGIAYSHLSDLTEDQNIFDELSESFVKLADLITEVSTSIKIDRLSISELLEFYANSGSETALKKLKSAGIVPLISMRNESG